MQDHVSKEMRSMLGTIFPTMISACESSTV